MSHIRTTGLLAALALGAFLMAGCSSGGGEPSVDASVHELLQQEYDAALLDLRAEREARQSAQTARNAAQAEVTRLIGELDTANGRVTALQTQIGAATDAANPAVTASLHAQLNAAKAEATTLTAQIGAATDTANPAVTASLHAQLNAAKAEVTRLTTLIGDPVNPSDTSLRGELAAATKRAEAAEAALEAVRSQLGTTQQELEEAQGDVEEAQQQAQQAQQQAQQAEEQADVSVRASAYLAAINAGGTARSGVTVNYERGSTLKINPGGNFQSGSGAPGISGFTARTYTRKVSSSEQTVYLYTNIQAPGTRPFWQLHGVNDIAAAQAATAFDPMPTGVAGVVRVGNTLNYADATTYDISVSGTYDGVSGTYTCSACTITDGDGDGDTDADDFDADDWVTLANGERSFVAGNAWTFKPGSVTSSVQQDRDNEHLYFGIWVLEPNVASGLHSYEYIVGGMTSVVTSNASIAGTALANFNTLTGIAKFKGGAIGKYVTRNQVGENARIGTFSATADFTANFGTDTEPGTLEGSITNFQGSGQALEGQWSLYLGDVTAATATTPASEVPIAFGAGTVTDADVSGVIGGVPVTGTWDATLYGSDNTEIALANRDDYPIASYPVANLAGIAGNFHASSPNAALAGAFGVTPSN